MAHTNASRRGFRLWLTGLASASAVVGATVLTAPAQQSVPLKPIAESRPVPQQVSTQANHAAPVNHCPPVQVCPPQQYYVPQQTHPSLCPPAQWHGPQTPPDQQTPLVPVPGVTAPPPNSPPQIVPEPNVPGETPTPAPFAPNAGGNADMAPLTNNFGGGGIATSLASASTDGPAMPGMIGDFFVGNNFTYQPRDGALAGATLSSPALTRSFKIIENQNPLPVDRVFGKMNYFDDVDGIGTEVYRYVVGFEKTILDGNASVQLKLPFFVLDAGGTGRRTSSGESISVFSVGSGTEADVGDLVGTFKYALYRDVKTGDVFSVGLSAVFPTGPDTIADVDRLTKTDIDHRGSVQPFAGFRGMLDDNWFVQGFSALDVPIDSDDATLWYNSLGVGYRYNCGNDSWINALIPQLEVHVNSPLNNESISVRPSQFAISRGLGFSAVNASLHDQVNLTSGLTAIVGNNSDITLAVTTPMAGPRPFDYEIHAQLNVYFGGIGQFGQLNPLNW